jgi:membrane-bound ClpP family serine protease
MATVAVGLLLGLCVGIVTVAAWRARRVPTNGPATEEVGSMGIALTPLGPQGIVRIGSEDWSATTDGPPVAAGELVRVLGRRGLSMRVRRAAGGAAATDKAFREARIR